MREQPQPLIELGNRESLIPDDFIVFLRKRYTLADHINWIQVDLRRVGVTGNFFRWYPERHAYRIRLRRSAVTDFILFDPTVDHAEQNARMEQAAPRRNTERYQERTLDRRQQNARRPMEWHIWMQQMPVYTPVIDPSFAPGVS